MRRTGFLTVVVFVLCACGSADMPLVSLIPGSLRTGIVARYTCDGDPDGQLIDSSGNGHTGTLLGVQHGEGRFGAGLHFQSGNYVTVQDFPKASPSFTVALWARPTSIAGQDYITLASTEEVFVGGWELNLLLGSNEWGYHFAYPVGGGAGQAYNYVDSPRMTEGGWTHLAGVVDERAMTITIYVDGQRIQRKSVPSLIQRGSSRLYLGRWAMEGRLFTGDMDDIVVYGRALSGDEIRLLYESPAPEPN